LLPCQVYADDQHCFCRDAWLRLIQPLIAQVPMLATIGEHFQHTLPLLNASACSMHQHAECPYHPEALPEVSYALCFIGVASALEKAFHTQTDLLALHHSLLNTLSCAARLCIHTQS